MATTPSQGMATTPSQVEEEIVSGVCKPRYGHNPQPGQGGHFNGVSHLHLSKCLRDVLAQIANFPRLHDINNPSQTSDGKIRPDSLQEVASTQYPRTPRSFPGQPHSQDSPLKPHASASDHHQFLPLRVSPELPLCGGCPGNEAVLGMRLSWE